MMGLLEIILCLIFGTFLPVQSTIDGRVAKVSGGFIEHILRSPVEGDYIPYDTIFSSWLTENPNFHMLGELPPQVPKVQVFCNGSQLTLLVDKRFNGILLKDEELQLGDGCYSNGDLENQLVFTYNFVQCGTNRVIWNGMDVFSNLLHFNPRKSLLTLWLSPFAVPISCIPERSEENPPIPVPVALPRMETGRRVALKAMNPSWTQTAESNVYQRGQNILLQVTANPGSDRKPFIHSCFVSASPDPKIRSRGWLIVNKGCTASVGPDHAMIQFVPSRREDVVNFILNTSHLISEVYVHCSVLISDKGITPDSKSCNYNEIQSRWEELSGDAEVCSCCSSKCKGSSLKRHVDAKAIVSTGPLDIVDMTPSSVQEQKDSSSTPVVNSMQSDSAGPGVTIYQTSSNPRSRSGGHSGPEGRIMYGATFSQSSFESNALPEAPWPSPPMMAEGVLMISQRPRATQALWLPGQVQITDAGLGEIQNSPLQSNSPGEFQLSDTLSNEIPALQPRARDQWLFSSPSTNKMRDEGLNEAEGDVPSMVDWWLPVLDGWPIPPKPEESPRRRWGGRPRMPHTRTQERYEALPVDVMNDLNLHESGGIDLKKEELAQRQAETVVPKEGNDAGFKSVIHSKLQLSQAMDGSQTLSYEEELKPGEGQMKTRRFEVNDIDMDQRKRGTGQRGLLSTFLNLLSRKLDKAE